MGENILFRGIRRPQKPFVQEDFYKMRSVSLSGFRVDRNASETKADGLIASLPTQ